MEEKMEWFKHHLSIRSRISFFISGIEELAQTWIWVADKPGHYKYHEWFGPMGRIEGMLSMVDTAIRGYVWGLRPLSTTAKIPTYETVKELFEDNYHEDPVYETGVSDGTAVNEVCESCHRESSCTLHVFLACNKRLNHSSAPTVIEGDKA